MMRRIPFGSASEKHDWRYSVGKSFIALKEPTGEKHIVNISQLLGISDSSFAQLKNDLVNMHGMLREYIVKNYPKHYMS